MEQIFIYPILACTCYLLYKVFKLKSREKKLKIKNSCLQDTLDAWVEAGKCLKTMEASNDNPEKSVLLPDETTDVDSYKETFLCRKPAGARRQTYVDSPYYEYMSRLLPVIATGTSFPMFLNNLLEEHLNRYSDLHDRLYEQKAKNAIKEFNEWMS